MTRPSINADRYRAVFFAAVMVTSMFAMPLAFTGGFGGSETGVVQATHGGDDVVYTASNDGTVKALDRNTGDLIWEFTGHSDDVRGVAPSPDGEVVYSGSLDNTVRAIDAETGDEIWQSTAVSDSAQSVRPSIDGQTVFVGTWGSTVEALDADTGDLVWQSSTLDGTPESISQSPDESTVYVAAGSIVYALDSGSGDVVWQTDIGNARSVEASVDGNTVYAGDFSGNVHSLDAGSGSTNWQSSLFSDSVNGIALSPGGESLYAGSGDETVKEVDQDTGDQVWSSSVPSGTVLSIAPSPDNSDVYAGGGFDVFAIDADTGDSGWTYTGHSGNVESVSTTAIYPNTAEPISGQVVDESGDPIENANVTVLDQSDWSTVYESQTNTTGEWSTELADGDYEVTAEKQGYGSTTETFTVSGSPVSLNLTLSQDTVSGVVKDQHGDPVENATVVGHGVAESALDPDAPESLEQQAEELRAELTDPTPPEWDNFIDENATPDGDRLDVNSFESSVDGTYPLVHQEDDWGTGLSNAITDNVDTPRVTVESGETVVLSAWDPSEDGGFVDTSPVRSSHPGAPTESTLVVEQISPTGEVTEERRLETTVTYTENRLGWSDREWHAAKTSLPSGVYQVYPEDNAAARYTFTVGEPDELWQSWEEDLRDRAGQLTDRADRIRSMVESEEIVRVTARTDANGQFQLDVPTNAVAVDVKAMKADGETLQGVQDPSLENLREAQAGAYNGSFYLPSPTPETVEPPAENVDITTYRSPEVPLGDMESYSDLLQFLEEQRLDEDLAELDSVVGERLGNLSDTELDRMHGDLENLTDEIDGINAELDGTESLEEEIEKLREELHNADRVDTEPPDSSLEDGVLDFEQEFDGDVSDVMATVEYENGDVETVPEEYVTVDESTLFGGDVVSIEEYPVPDDRAVADVTVRAATDTGLGVGGGTVQNPAFNGALPEIDAVDFSTLSPGSDERVFVGIDADSDEYSRLTGIEAYNPDGKALESSVNGTTDRATFVTDGAGVHHVRLTFKANDGGEFVVHERLRALEQPRSDPATIRTGSSPIGEYAVIGEVLESARVETDGDTLDATAFISPDEIPGSVHIYPEGVLEGTTNEVNLQVVEGSDESHVQSHIETVVHFQQGYDDETIAWRSGEPIQRDAGTRFGEVTERETPDGDSKYVLRTFTEEDGSVTVRAIKQPGRLERLNHWVASNIGMPNIPFLSTASVVALPSAVLLVRKRRPF